MAAGRRLNIRDFERSTALSASDITWANHFAQLFIDATYTASIIITQYDTTRKVGIKTWEAGYQNFNELWIHSHIYLPEDINKKASDFLKQRYIFQNISSHVVEQFITLFLEYAEAIHRSERLMSIITENKIQIDREEKPDGIHFDPLRKD